MATITTTATHISTTKFYCCHCAHYASSDRENYAKLQVLIHIISNVNADEINRIINLTTMLNIAPWLYSSF